MTAQPTQLTSPKSAEGEQGFGVSLEQQDRFQFTVDFGLDGVPRLLADEAPPLGGGTGPNPARLLAAAVGSCLSASLYFCLSKARVDAGPLRTTVTGTMERNQHGRLRITGLNVSVHVPVSPESGPRLDRCLGLFEDFCIVTQSVREGIEVAVEVQPVPREASALIGS